LKPLDAEFQRAIRERIERARAALKIEEAVQALGAFINGTAYLSKEQLKAIEITLKHGLPAQKAVEHTGEVKHSLVDLVNQSMHVTPTTKPNGEHKTH
jgi:t-SNARE complex subunit (syntaxin)